MTASAPFRLPLPPIRPLTHGNGEAYELTEPLRFGDEQVDAGYVTDLASTPRPLRTLAPTSGLHTAPAIRHDRRCDDLRHGLDPLDGTRRLLTSRQADREFREGIRQLDPDRPLRAWAMWAGVRLGCLNPRSPWRRDGWGDLLRDAPLVLLVSALVAPIYVPTLALNLVAQLADGAANLAARLLCRLVHDHRQPAPEATLADLRLAA